MTIHHHLWTRDKQGDTMCKWCRCAKTPASMGQECGAVVHAMKTTTRITLVAGPAAFQSVGDKIKIIKLLRDAIPNGLERDLKHVKTLVDDLKDGKTVKVRVSTPGEVGSALKDHDITVTWEDPVKPKLSEHAKRVLTALEQKPELLEELRAHFRWD